MLQIPGDLHREGLQEGSWACLDARAVVLAGSSQQIPHIVIVPCLPYLRGPAVVLPWPSRQLILEPACNLWSGSRGTTSGKQGTGLGTFALSSAFACFRTVMLCFLVCGKM